MLIKDLFKEYVYPVAVLMSGIIGLGIFSLPYVAVQSGIWILLFYLAFSVCVVATVNSIFGEIALKTPDFKRFPGFVGFHLGKWAETVSLFTSIFGGFGVLLVYLIVGGDFFKNAFLPFFGGDYLTYVILYFAIAGIFIYFDIKAIKRIEFFALLLFIFALILVFAKGFFTWSWVNVLSSNETTDLNNIFFPYGVIMFSLWGFGLIPEVEEMIKKHKKNLKKIIVASVLITAFIYLLFVFLTLGITGVKTTDSALVGLQNTLSSKLMPIVLFAGALLIFNAFLSLALILKKVFMYDVGIKKSHSIIIVCCVPLILFLLGLRSFIPIISFIGGVFIGIEGILILLMYKKIGGKKAAIFPLALVFALGVIYQIVYFIK